jgi:hypothetical protein
VVAAENRIMVPVAFATLAGVAVPVRRKKKHKQRLHGVRVPPAHNAPGTADAAPPAPTMAPQGYGGAYGGAGGYNAVPPPPVSTPGVNPRLRRLQLKRAAAAAASSAAPSPPQRGRFVDRDAPPPSAAVDFSALALPGRARSSGAGDRGEGDGSGSYY